MSEAILTPTVSGDEERLRSSGRRALVVEDDPATRLLVIAVLRREGFAVDAAANGHDALTLLRNHAHALIVLDLTMRELNGVDLLEELRHRDAQMLRRVLVITTSVPRLRPELPAEICHVLTKPFDLTDFQAAVAHCAAEAAL